MPLAENQQPKENKLKRFSCLKKNQINQFAGIKNTYNLY